MTTYTLSVELGTMTLSMPDIDLRLNRILVQVKNLTLAMPNVAFIVKRATSVSALTMTTTFETFLLKKIVKVKIPPLSMFLSVLPVSPQIHQDTQLPASFSTLGPSLPGVYSDDD